MFPNALMSPQIGEGQMVRAPTRLEWEIMKDLGWDVVTTLHWTHGAGTLNWTDAANWDNPSAPPDATWDVVLTSAGLADGSTLNLGGNGSVNVLTIDSTAGFTLGGASGTLTIVKGNLTRTAASAGNQAIARPVALGASAVWDIAGSGELAVTGGLSGTGFGLTKQGGGTLVLSGTCTYTGPTAVQGGTLALAGGGSASSGYTVAAGATLLASAPTLTLAGTLSNAGTLRVQGGTLTVSGSVAQLVGTALAGGAWEVDADAALNLVAGSPIATNKATVVLDGPNSLFAKFDSVLASEGSLTILDGRTFTTASDFSNAGLLRVGAGSLLAVTGTFTQTAGYTTIDGQLTAASGWADILGGVLDLNADAGAGGALLSLDVVGSSVYCDADQHLDTLVIGTGGKVVLRHAGVLVLNDLQIGGLGLGAVALTPEPATLALLVLGGLVAVLHRRRASR
jgi:autotransporter-associated beta strand protein